MDSNARKQIKVITDFFNRQKKNSKEKSLITENSIITSKIKANEKPGLYIKKGLLIELIRGLSSDEIKISASNSSHIIIVIPKT